MFKKVLPFVFLVIMVGCSKSNSPRSGVVCLICLLYLSDRGFEITQRLRIKPANTENLPRRLTLLENPLRDWIVHIQRHIFVCLDIAPEKQHSSGKIGLGYSQSFSGKFVVDRSVLRDNLNRDRETSRIDDYMYSKCMSYYFGE